MSKERRIEPLPEPAQIEYVPELIRPFAETVTAKANEIFAPARKSVPPDVVWEFANENINPYLAVYVPDEHSVEIYVPFTDMKDYPVQGIHGKIKDSIGLISPIDRSKFFKSFRKVQKKYKTGDQGLWKIYCDNLYKTLTDELPYKARNNYNRKFSKRVDSLFQPYIQFSDLEKLYYVANMVHEFHHAEFNKRTMEGKKNHFMFDENIYHNLGVIEGITQFSKSEQEYIQMVRGFDPILAHKIITNTYIQVMAMVDNEDVSKRHASYMIWSSINEEIAQDITDVFFQYQMRSKRNRVMYYGGYSPATHYPLSRPVSEYLRSKVVRRPIKHIGFRIAQLYKELFEGGVLSKLIDYELTHARHHYTHGAYKSK